MKKIGLDIETSGIEFDAQIAGVSIYDPELDKAEFLPINMVGCTDVQRDLSIAKVRELVSTCSLVGHNLMFDLIHLRQLLPDVVFNVAGDSLIIAHMAQLKTGKLKDLVLAYGVARNDEVVKLKDLADDFNFTRVSVDEDAAITYACNDAKWAYQLEELLYKKYEKSLKLYSLELRVLPVFVDMTCSGMRLQWDEFQHFIQKYGLMVDSLKMQLDREAGFSFATRSRRDMESIIVDRFGLVPSVRTPKGEYSYSLESLKHLDHPWVRQYLDYSHKFSTKNSMLTIDKFVYAQDGDWWIHPTYKQVGFDGTSRVYTCISGSAIIVVDGEPIRIDEFVKGGAVGRVQSVDGFANVLEGFATGKKKVIQVELECGRKLRCSEDHLIGILDSGNLVWRRAGDLVGDEDVIVG